MINYKAEWGITIREAARKAIRLADTNDDTVKMEFCGVDLEITPSTKIYEIINEYLNKIETDG